MQHVAVLCVTSVFYHFSIGKSHGDKLKRLETEIKEEYINMKIQEKTQEVKENNQRVRTIAKGWVGVTTDDVFRSWRTRVDETKKEERRRGRKKVREIRLQYLDDLAKYQLAKIEVNSHLAVDT